MSPEGVINEAIAEAQGVAKVTESFFGDLPPQLMVFPAEVEEEFDMFASKSSIYTYESKYVSAT